MTRSQGAALVVIAVASIALVAGWHQFWLVCDDAYIDFRYVSNAHRGLGYVWNAPPWRPVEGYTSLLWVVLLDLAWTWTGWLPPDAAPRMSLGFSLGSLAVIASTTWRMPLSERLAPWRVGVLAAVLLNTVSNRGFLAWTSGGLETPLFTMMVLAWVSVATSSGSTVLLSGIAAVICLVRPDGLLFAAATALIVAVRTREDRWASLGALAFVLVPVGHILWRWQTYGYFLPNTYYAKHIGPWPLAGSAYFAGFILEYYYWIWIALVGVAARRWRRIPADRAQLGRWIGVAAVVAQWAYYTFDVGGDHFEYRVYHHLIPLVAISFFALGDGIGLTARRTFVIFAWMTSFGWVVPWTHWAYTHDATRPKDRGSFRYPIAEHFPWPYRAYVHAWDGLQAFTIGHFVGIRHQGHKTYASYQKERFPSRETGERLDAGPLAVFSHTSIGYPAWTLAGVAIIDERGLSDLVVARTKPKHTGQVNRVMAHDRLAPRAYVKCFQPNVKVDKQGEIQLVKRAQPLTEDDVRRCEEEWLDKVDRGEY